MLGEVLRNVYIYISVASYVSDVNVWPRYGFCVPGRSATLWKNTLSCASPTPSTSVMARSERTTCCSTCCSGTAWSSACPSSRTGEKLSSASLYLSTTCRAFKVSIPASLKRKRNSLWVMTILYLLVTFKIKEQQIKFLVLNVTRIHSHTDSSQFWGRVFYLHVLSPAGCQEQIPLTWREWRDWPTSPRRYSEIQFPPPNMAPSASWATGCAPKTWTTSSTWGSPTVWKVGWKWVCVELHWMLNLYPEGTVSTQVTIDNCVKDELRMRVFRITLSSCIERELFP